MFLGLTRLSGLPKLVDDVRPGEGPQLLPCPDEVVDPGCARGWFPGVVLEVVCFELAVAEQLRVVSSRAVGAESLPPWARVLPRSRWGVAAHANPVGCSCLCPGVEFECPHALEQVLEVDAGGANLAQVSRELPQVSGRARRRTLTRKAGVIG